MSSVQGGPAIATVVVGAVMTVVDVWDVLSSQDVPILAVTTLFAVVAYGVSLGRWAGSVDTRLDKLEQEIKDTKSQMKAAGRHLS